MADNQHVITTVTDISVNAVYIKGHYNVNIGLYWAAISMISIYMNDLQHVITNV